MRLFQKQSEHEKREMIFEVLAPLAENGKEGDDKGERERGSGKDGVEGMIVCVVRFGVNR